MKNNLSIRDGSVFTLLFIFMAPYFSDQIWITLVFNFYWK